jgi:hypothetical protein
MPNLIIVSVPEFQFNFDSFCLESHLLLNAHLRRLTKIDQLSVLMCGETSLSDVLDLPQPAIGVGGSDFFGARRSRIEALGTCHPAILPEVRLQESILRKIGVSP